jgi:hypothetical protein
VKGCHTWDSFLLSEEYKVYRRSETSKDAFSIGSWTSGLTAVSWTCAQRPDAYPALQLIFLPFCHFPFKYSPSRRFLFLHYTRSVCYATRAVSVATRSRGERSERNYYSAGVTLFFLQSDHTGFGGNMVPVTYPGIKWPGCNGDHSPRLVQRLRMSRHVPPSPPTSSCCGV